MLVKPCDRGRLHPETMFSNLKNSDTRLRISSLSW